METTNKTRATAVKPATKPTITVGYNAFASLLMGLKKGRIATFEAITVPDMNKGGNPHLGHIVKHSRCQVCWDADYANAVNNRRAKDGLETRDIKARAWGVHLKGTPFSFHVPKGSSTPKLYVRMYIIKSLGYVYIDMRTGAEVDKESVTPFLRKRSKSEIIWREYGIGTILKVSADGATYVVSHTFALPSAMLPAAYAALDAANKRRAETRRAAKAAKLNA